MICKHQTRNIISQFQRHFLPILSVSYDETDEIGKKFQVFYLNYEKGATPDGMHTNWQSCGLESLSTMSNVKNDFRVLNFWLSTPELSDGNPECLFGVSVWVDILHDHIVQFISILGFILRFKSVLVETAPILGDLKKLICPRRKLETKLWSNWLFLVLY